MDNTHSAERPEPSSIPCAAIDGRPGAPVRISSPADVLAVVPHVLGFHPATSLVVIGVGGLRDRIELGFRYDLPDPPSATAAGDIADHAVAVLAHQRISTVIAVGYGPGPLVTPVVDAFRAAAREAGLAIRELLRAQDGRYWSYLCDNLDCCPPEGVPFDPASHPASAVMRAAGMRAYPDRESRAATLGPLTGAAAEAMDRAADRACDRAASLIASGKRRSRAQRMRPVIDAGRAAVRGAIGVYRGGGEVDDDAIAWLAVTMTHLAVRDDAWARMDPEHKEAHVRLWTDVVRRVGDLWVAAPAALLAFAAWQCGDGVLANIAIERALAADPGYSLALLLREVIDAGAPPSAALAPLTPDEVASSYEERAARDDPSREERAARDDPPPEAGSQPGPGPR